MIFTLALIGLLLLAAAGTWWLTPAARRWAFRVGLVDHPDPNLPRKEQKEPVPYGGGVVVFGVVTGLAGALWLAGALAGRFGGAVESAAWWADAPEAVRAAWGQFVQLGRGVVGGDGLRKGAALLAGGALVFGIGLYDDFRPLPARVKLALQMTVTLLPLWAGYRIQFPYDLFGHEGWGGWVALGMSWGASWLWIVLVTNAFNLLDNMDGLSAGVTVWSSVLFGVVAWQHGQYMVAAMLALLAGAMAGFLRHNWPPATAYLGDGGALFAGYLLGVLTIGTHFYAEGRGGIYAVATPVCVLAVPLYDSLSVLYIRWRSGKPLFVGDRNHLSHRLVRLGLSRREAVLAVYLLTAITGGTATLLVDLGPAGAAAVFGLTLAILLLVWLLETAARRNDNA